MDLLLVFLQVWQALGAALAGKRCPSFVRKWFQVQGIVLV
jgi:hypothetical protein